MAFSTALNNICFVLLIACGLYYTAKEGINVRLSRTSILSIVIVALLLIDIVVFAETPKDYKVGLRYLILLCTPIILMGGGKRFFKRFLMAYLLAYAVVFLFVIVGIVSNYWQYGEFNFYKFGGNTQSFLIFERLYFGFMSMIAAVFVYMLCKTNLKMKYVLLAAIFIVNFILASRLSFLFLTVFLVYNIYVDLKSKISFKHIFILLMALSVLTVIGLKNEGFKKRFFLNSSSIDNYMLQLKIHEPRYAIWRCAFQIAGKEWGKSHFIGLDTERELQEKLVDCYGKTIYIKDKRAWFVKARYNTHNQFLHTYLMHGIIGIVLVLILILVYAYSYRGILPSMWLLFLIIVFSLVENVLMRQVGVFLLATCFAVLGKKIKND
ncbi:hypothetical protein PY092_01290 [Muricauda sp. 334s03]|uniref:O-antigen ligase-related domain-containing protein n=1 Tax=Flagellimonas yonaguniensis TaxID=3031325 RepID=A0ABT5XUB2_9FLAO|nr:O-antigen ligase family protein [[Muricauda] yonaguniensis]MDF0714768.1 hypothetical protein [[Muricauda] yonaguniensis]